MAYAGICRHDNLQPHSDPYWSQWSFQEIMAYITSSRPAINEVQTVSLRDFDGTDSFRLSFNGNQTAPIMRGPNYSTAGIETGAGDVAGWPTGGLVTVAPFGGGGGGLNDTGFQLTFVGTLASLNQEAVSLTDVSGPPASLGRRRRVARSTTPEA